MPESQKVEQVWATPSHDEIAKISKAHVAGLESSDDEGVWTVGGMPHVVLYTIGRKSGAEHPVALPTWTDPDGHRIVVASYAGAEKHPAWFLNLRDGDGRALRCRVRGGEFTTVPEILAGEERARIWSLLLEDRAWYADYQAKTDREIPLVRLRESG